MISNGAWSTKQDMAACIYLVHVSKIQRPKWDFGFCTKLYTVGNLQVNLIGPFASPLLVLLACKSLELESIHQQCDPIKDHLFDFYFQPNHQHASAVTSATQPQHWNGPRNALGALNHQDLWLYPSVIHSRELKLNTAWSLVANNSQGVTKIWNNSLQLLIASWYRAITE